MYNQTEVMRYESLISDEWNEAKNAACNQTIIQNVFINFKAFNRAEVHTIDIYLNN